MARPSGCRVGGCLTRCPSVVRSNLFARAELGALNAAKVTFTALRPV
ncbi:hypothetical protein [Kibdelosporangium philippinense]